MTFAGADESLLFHRLDRISIGRQRAYFFIIFQVPQNRVAAERICFKLESVFQVRQQVLFSLGEFRRHASSFLLRHLSSPEKNQPSVCGSRRVGDSVRQQTPYRCHKRNHGLCASVSSCLRFAAEMSLALSGLMSGASNISCICSMSSMMRSTSMRHNHLGKDA